MTANNDQLDNNDNGVGDVCEITAFNLTDFYLMRETVASFTGSGCQDVTQGEVLTVLDHWEQRGNSAIISGRDDAEEFRVIASLDAQGNISLDLMDEFEGGAESLVLTASYDDANRQITGTIVETEQELISGTLTDVCTVTYDIVADVGDPVTDLATVLTTGIYLGDGEEWNQNVEFEYDEIMYDGSVTTETFFYYDPTVGIEDWVMESEAETLIMLGAGGWTEVPDLLEIQSVTSNTMTTSLVSGSEVFATFNHEFISWDVSGDYENELLPPYWQENVTDELLTFPQGSRLMVVNTTVDVEGFEVDCDRDDMVQLDCANIVQLDFDPATQTPTPATSLSELLTPIGSTEPVRIPLYGDNQVLLSVIMEGSDPSAGNSGSVTLELDTQNTDPVTLGTAEWRSELVQGETLVFIDLPEYVSYILDIDAIERSVLFAVIPDPSDNNDYVRIGNRIAAELDMDESGFYNDTAFDSILSNFSFSIP